MIQQLSTTEQIEAGLADVLASPKDVGTLEVIVICPATDQREFLKAAHLSPEGGVQGDKWATSSWLRLRDGRPDPRVQVALMNARILRLIACEADRMRLAGDNLIMDFDLSEGNVVVGQKLAVGEVLLEVSDVPHSGCKKFEARYGKEAVAFINGAKGKPLRLRGIFARILQGGTVRLGNLVKKV